MVCKTHEQGPVEPEEREMATQMKAPPSTKAEIVDVGFAHKALVERLSPGGATSTR